MITYGIMSLGVFLSVVVFSLYFTCASFAFLQHWLTELEIFAMIFAASIHDYEHTGTTNNFHIQTRYQVLLLHLKGSHSSQTVIDPANIMFYVFH